MLNVQCHVFLEIIQHRLLECLDGWEEKLNYQQCQQTAALAKLIATFGVLRVQTLGTKALNKEFIRTPKLTCSRVTKTNYNLHGNQSKLPLFCEISIKDFKTLALFLGQKTLKSLVSAECLFIKAKSSHETTHTVHKSLQWNLDNCIHEPPHCHHICKTTSLLPNFKQCWWFQAILIFWKKDSLRLWLLQ